MNQNAASEPIAYAGPCSTQAGHLNFILLIIHVTTRTPATNISCPTSTPYIEKEQCQRYVRLRQSDLGQRPGKTKSVQKPETERNKPGSLRR